MTTFLLLPRGVSAILPSSLNLSHKIVNKVAQVRWSAAAPPPTLDCPLFCETSPFAFLPPPLSLKSLSFLLCHDRKSDETSRLVLRGWRADLSDLEKGAREPVQDSCPTYSGRLRDLNGNISLPPNPEWPSENVRLAVRPIHFLERFSNSFCTSAASFPSISLPTVIHSELALCSFRPFAKKTLSLLSV